ncbi:MAG: hypothetical protein D8M18_11175 [Bacteroidetes bacterium]|nr:hypothetical protein [Bacteroidota bacterium]
MSAAASTAPMYGMEASITPLLEQCSTHDTVAEDHGNAAGRYLRTSGLPGTATLKHRTTLRWEEQRLGHPNTRTMKSRCTVAKVPQEERRDRNADAEGKKPEHLLKPLVVILVPKPKADADDAKAYSDPTQDSHCDVEPVQHQ